MKNKFNDNINVFVGPNGSGKTHMLEEIQGEYSENCIYLQSELLFSNEIKDSNKESFAFDYIVSEILSDKEVIDSLDTLNKSLDKAAKKKNSEIYNIWEKAASINSEKAVRKSAKPILSADEIKLPSLKYIKLGSTSFKSMGTGQKMYFLLELINKFSNREIVLIDEPEKYCHPSLINEIAGLIVEISKNKKVYVASHNPQLVSMMNVPLKNIYIFGYDKHAKFESLKDDTKQVIIEDILNVDSNTKEINDVDFVKIYDELSKMSERKGFKYLIDYYKKLENIEEYIRFRYKDIINMFFTKNLFLVEGGNDKVFLEEKLKHEDKYFEEYQIIETDGKPYMPLFIKIFNAIKPKKGTVRAVFDGDKDNPLNKTLNHIIGANVDEFIVSWTELEDQIGYYEFVKNTFNLGDDDKDIIKKRKGDIYLFKLFLDKNPSLFKEIKFSNNLSLLVATKN